MTAPAFAPFVAPEPTAEGDRFSPKDNIGHVLVVKVNEHKTGIVTANSANGTDAVSVDLVDLDDPAGPRVCRDALLFGGAMVDGLTPYVGQHVVIKIESRNSKSGRTYPVPVAAQPPDIARAQAYFAVNPNPFAPVLSTVVSQPDPWSTQAQQAPAQPAWTPPPPPPANVPAPPQAVGKFSAEQVAGLLNAGWPMEQIQASAFQP